MLLLGAHPRIAAFQAAAHDARLAAYWMSVMAELCQPRSYLAPFAPRDMSVRRWWLGDAGTSEPRAPDLEDWLDRNHPAGVAAMCQQQLDAFYTTHAEVDASGAPAYFVEKFVPRQPAIPLLKEIYPGAKEILLVRDFRDMLSSILAFNRKRGYRAFGRDRVVSDAEYVRKHLRNSAQALLERRRAHAEVVHLIRYEDLIASPESELAAALAYLELDGDANRVRQMIEAAGRQSAAGHRTTPDPEASIGRWRQDLSPELIEVCAHELGEALAGFGYE